MSLRMSSSDSGVSSNSNLSISYRLTITRTLLQIMNTPQKSLFLLGLGGLASVASATAGLNTSDLTGYVGGTYLGAETIRQSAGFNR